jgi:hypothetical protein
VISGYRKRPAPKENPEAREFALRGLSLRDRVHNSNFILLKIPIEIKVLEHGEKFTVIDYDRVQAELGVSASDVASLQKSGLILPLRPAKTSKPRIDYDALQQGYAKMMSDGPFKTQTELARHLGVSRVWVSRVLKGIRKKAS